MSDMLKIGGKEFASRLFLGTGKFASNKLIPEVVDASGAQLITVAVRRVDTAYAEENILTYIPKAESVSPANFCFDKTRTKVISKMTLSNTNRSQIETNRK